ncbi:hypothetical protein NQZ79_g7199 [Umbelopsis isabellina]|nr:hypothetical protein NQZ79_g7199 [Umbelopsis isabellina]
MDTARQKITDRNALFKEHSETVNSLRNALLRELTSLVQEFSLDDQRAAAVAAYMNDRVTLFRFLLRNDYSLPTALSLLLKNIRWRLKNEVDTLTYKTLPSELFDSPFVFFHKQDKLQRPVLVINVQYLPKYDSSVFVEKLRPFMILIMEMARKLTRDITMVREERGEKLPLVQDLVIIVNLANAGRVPMDKQFGQMLIDFVSNKYPAMVGSVIVLNFGWMYQGIWQMIKLILTDNAKQKISFPKPAELANLIDREDILQELGGVDEYTWTKESDTVLHKYGSPDYGDGDVDMDDAVVPNISRSSSMSTIFFDAKSDGFDIPSSITISSSAFEPPSDTRPPQMVPSSTALSKIHIPKASRAVDYSSIAYLRSWLQSMTKGVSRSNTTLNFQVPTVSVQEHSNTLRSLINHQQQQQELFPSQDEEDNESDADEGIYLSPRTSNALSPPQTPILSKYSRFSDIAEKNEFVRYWLTFVSKCRRGLQRLARSMLHYHSILYWVVIYLLLRGGVTELINYTLRMSVKLIAANGGLGVEGSMRSKPQGTLARIFSSLMEEFPGRLAL